MGRQLNDDIFIFKGNQLVGPLGCCTEGAFQQGRIHSFGSCSFYGIVNFCNSRLMNEAFFYGICMYPGRALFQFILRRLHKEDRSPHNDHNQEQPGKRILIHFFLS